MLQFLYQWSNANVKWQQQQTLFSQTVPLNQQKFHWLNDTFEIFLLFLFKINLWKSSLWIKGIMNDTNNSSSQPKSSTSSVEILNLADKNRWSLLKKLKVGNRTMPIQCNNVTANFILSCRCSKKSVFPQCDKWEREKTVLKHKGVCYENWDKQTNLTNVQKKLKMVDLHRPIN